MTDRSRYVFGAALAGVALGGIPGLLDQADARPIAANFTFEVSGPAISGTGPMTGPFLAESGLGSAFGVHASTSTVWSSPAGNGSPESFSSNGWALGDYYEFDVPTTGLENILISFDQAASSTGPKSFRLFYSTDGSAYSSFTTYSVLINQAQTIGTTTVGAWSTATSHPAYNVSIDLSSILGLDNNPLASFRLVDADTTATAAAGTNRVDNVVISGDLIPEPAGLTLLTAAAGAALLRRRRNA
jgi:hypothetical protein